MNWNETRWMKNPYVRQIVSSIVLKKELLMVLTMNFPMIQAIDFPFLLDGLLSAAACIHVYSFLDDVLVGQGALLINVCSNDGVVNGLHDGSGEGCEE